MKCNNTASYEVCINNYTLCNLNDAALFRSYSVVVCVISSQNIGDEEDTNAKTTEVFPQKKPGDPGAFEGFLDELKVKHRYNRLIASIRYVRNRIGSRTSQTSD
jgi:hypothetical protein